METRAETVGMMEKITVGSHNISNFSHLTSIDVPTVPFIDRVLFFIKPIVEYAFGVYMGFVIGWLLGLCLGNIYAEQFKPLYFSNLNELRQWMLMSYDFARCTAFIGTIAGAIIIAIINSKLFSRRVLALYEAEVTKPKNIARRLGKSEIQTQRVINKLAKKGKIICEKANFPERLPA
jgi:hypothetical protein